jgi:hypothetical protein
MSYLSAIIYTSMIPNIQNFRNKIKGSSLSLPAYEREEQGQHLLFRRRFLRSKKRNSAANARAGRAFPFPVPLFLPAPPERNFLEISIRIFFEKGSDFIQDRQPICKISVSRLARGCAPRFGGRIFKQFPNEPIFFALRANAKRQLFRRRRNCPKAT